MSGYAKGHKEGASKSLRLTITEIMDFLGHEDQPKGKLRPILHEKIGDLAAYWFNRGFNRGHIESHTHFISDGLVPEILEYECSRMLSPKQDRKLNLRSKIRKAKKKKKIATLMKRK